MDLFHAYSGFFPTENLGSQISLPITQPPDDTQDESTKQPSTSQTTIYQRQTGIQLTQLEFGLLCGSAGASIALLLIIVIFHSKIQQLVKTS